MPQTMMRDDEQMNKPRRSVVDAESNDEFITINSLPQRAQLHRFTRDHTTDLPPHWFT